ncbi:hypothetical protein BY458DRAFT_545027 [Sporodiniella umbellata]|nr:hypothetical protein BY458DRAFT_545027 [Sporodiniella umbellata]
MKISYNNKTQQVGIPRPLNCFLIYRNEKQKEILAQCPGANHRDLSKIIATWWKNATDLEKEPFRNKARIAKQEHRKKYPEYKYAPKRKDGPKRAYVRKGQHEKFTSKSQERNALMNVMFGHDVEDKVTAKKEKCTKKKTKKPKLPKNAAPPEDLGCIGSSSLFEISPYTVQSPFDSIFGYYGEATPSSCDASISTSSPVLTFRSETPNTEGPLTNYFNRDLEECLSFTFLNTPSITAEIMAQNQLTNYCLQYPSYQMCTYNPITDYSDPMYAFN